MDYTTKSILVCDDSILARKQLKDAISVFCDGVTIYEGKNGREAVELYKEHKPDLVLLDIVMPEMDGTEAVKEIVDFDPSATVIIVSSVGTQLQLKNAITAGAKDFIQKPFEVSQIQSLIQTHLKGE